MGPRGPLGPPGKRGKRVGTSPMSEISMFIIIAYTSPFNFIPTLHQVGNRKYFARY